MRERIEDEMEKKKVLRSMEVFVLDNSLRESTVGHPRGHTTENKWKIYEQVTAKNLLFGICGSENAHCFSNNIFKQCYLERTKRWICKEWPILASQLPPRFNF